MQSVGDDLIGVEVSCPRAAQSLADQLRAGAAWLEVVAGIDSVVVRYDTLNIDRDAARNLLKNAQQELQDVSEQQATLVEIPIVYGGDAGPDFATVCEQLQMSAEAFVALHTAGEYEVDMLGFTPGFAYIGGLDSKLRVPRLKEPRVRVAAGSVGIADGRTGLYALQGPGGWPLIGYTALPLFDAAAANPFILKAGMKIRFVVADRS